MAASLKCRTQVLRRLADHPAIQSIHYDRPTSGKMNRAAVTVGARAVQWELGYTGAGIGVAVIDSGITSWHDDLGYHGSSSQVRTMSGQRVVDFVDFVNGRTTPYDDNGHGTHVAGIDRRQRLRLRRRARRDRARGAPGRPESPRRAGRGVISDVIAALDWMVTNKTAHNIRVVNLSVGAAVTESYNTDPLTLAAKRAVDAGIVVVAAAGNFGKNTKGETQYGGDHGSGQRSVGADGRRLQPPGHGDSRIDDTMAPYSSRGPSAFDFERQARPRRAGHGHRVAERSDEHVLHDEGFVPVHGTRPTAYQAVPELERHQHGGAGRHRHRSRS